MRHIVLNMALLVMFCSPLASSCTNTSEHRPIPITHSELNIIRVDGTDRRVLSNEGWAPVLTDSIILFSRGNFALFTIEYDGSNLSPFYPGTGWGDHCLSPNGDKLLIASSSFESNQYQNELYFADLNGNNLTKLTPAKALYIWPHVSPNLDEIVFQRGGGIATIRIDGTNEQYISTKTDSTSCSYAVFFDQTRILYTEAEGSAFNVKLFDKTTQTHTALARLSRSFSIFGKVVADSSLLVFNRDTIKTLNVFTGVIQSIGRASSASFSSDGLQIVVSQIHSLYTMSADGSNLQLIYANQDRTITDPQFSPNGQFIVFQILWDEYWQ